MAEKTLAQKLALKPGQRLLLVNAPPAYREQFGELPPGATLSVKPTQAADVIQAFVQDRKQLEKELGRLKRLLSPKGALWVTYHKGTSKDASDINRDTINAYAHTLGLQGVAMISIDKDWSALRLKAIE